MMLQVAKTAPPPPPVPSLAGLAGLGLAPGDPCYDTNHPWYLPNFFSNAVECACMAANYGSGPGQYPCGQQCVGYGPDSCSVFSTMGNQAGSLVGGAVDGAVEHTGIPTTLILAVVGLAAVFLVTR